MITPIRIPTTLAAVICLSLAGCSPEKEAEKSAEVLALEADYLQLSAQLKELSEEKDSLEASIEENKALLESTEKDLKREASLREEVLPISNYLKSLERASNTVKADVETWRQATRDSYVGMNIPELQTSSGTIHPNVTISEIHDEQFVVEDADGNKIEIPFTDVNEAIRNALVHEPTVLSQ